MKNKLLPLGTIIKHKGSNTLIMIIGYGMVDNNTKKQYDYSGCTFPIGYDTEEICMFNNEDIDSLIFMGYQTPQSIKYRELMDEYLKDIKGGMNVEDANTKLRKKLGELK